MGEGGGGFGGERRKPWDRPRGLDEVLRRWRESKQVSRCLALDAEVPGRLADYAPFPPALAPEVRRALEARGIERLYSHQARAFELASQGRDLVVATPTASGKSLCFDLPVFDRLARDPEARAILESEAPDAL